jgi:hypothetical protein
VVSGAGICHVRDCYKKNQNHMRDRRNDSFTPCPGIGSEHFVGRCWYLPCETVRTGERYPLPGVNYSSFSPASGNWTPNDTLCPSWLRQTWQDHGFRHRRTWRGARAPPRAIPTTVSTSHPGE